MVDPSVAFTSSTTDMSLHMERPPMNGTTKVLRFPICHITNNATTRDALNYIIADNLAHYSTTMSILHGVFT